MIINPAEEITILTDDIDILEQKLELLANTDETELNAIDMKALEIYSNINELQLELLDFIEAEQSNVEAEEEAAAAASE
jgi:phage-related protein